MFLCVCVSGGWGVGGWGEFLFFLCFFPVFLRTGRSFRDGMGTNEITTANLFLSLCLSVSFLPVYEVKIKIKLIGTDGLISRWLSAGYLRRFKRIGFKHCNLSRFLALQVFPAHLHIGRRRSSRDLTQNQHGANGNATWKGERRQLSIVRKSTAVFSFSNWRLFLTNKRSASASAPNHLGGVEVRFHLAAVSFLLKNMKKIHCGVRSSLQLERFITCYFFSNQFSISWDVRLKRTLSNLTKTLKTSRASDIQ